MQLERGHVPTSVLRASSVLLVLVASLGACTTGDDDPAIGDGRTAAIYDTILDWLIEEDPVVVDGVEPVVFVTTRSEASIDIDVQVAVVEAMDAIADVRFIDERAEAVDLDMIGAPVRDAGMLIGLGAVPADGDLVEIYVDRYRHDADVAAWSASIRRSGNSWSISGTPVETEVRPIPDGS